MSVNIFTLHDQLLEENETFSVHMMTSDPAVALTSINRTVLIIDNDGQCKYSINYLITYIHYAFN